MSDFGFYSASMFSARPFLMPQIAPLSFYHFNPGKVDCTFAYTPQSLNGFNYNIAAFNFPKLKTPDLTFSKSPVNKSDLSLTQPKLSPWEKIGYDPQKGLKLAAAVKKLMEPSWPPKGSGKVARCAEKVNDAILNSGLGSRPYGHACDLPRILEKYPNLKEINVSDINLKTLPAGCIIAYEPGAAGYNKTYGHVEITLGDGTAGSHARTNNIRQADKGIRVFVPVSSSMVA